MQLVLTTALLLSLPLWKQKASETFTNGEPSGEHIGILRTLSIRGVKEVAIAFLCYCALEQTAGLWAVSYVVLEKGIEADVAAGWGALFYMGITVGRFLNGFLAEKFSDSALVRAGTLIIGGGVAVMLLPLGNIGALIGLCLIGLGCAPVYPCLIHATPARFGKENSQAVIGIQMATAYVGSTFVPPLFGLIADNITIGLLPLFLLAILAVMLILCERLNRITSDK